MNDLPKSNLTVINSKKYDTIEDVLNELCKKNTITTNEIKVHEKIKNLKLTQAEKILLYEGTQSGEADCSLPISKIYEITIFNTELNENIIRSEILEWLLRPKISDILMKAGHISIIGADIKRTSETLVNKKTQKSSESKSSEKALILKNTRINIDLHFKRCSFSQGIDLDNSMTQTLFFDECEIGYNSENRETGDFTATNAIINGNLTFTSWINSNYYNRSTVQKKAGEVNDINGSILLNFTTIKGYFKCDGGYQIKTNLEAANLNCTNIICDNISAYSIELSDALIKGQVTFNLSKIRSTINAIGLSCTNAYFQEIRARSVMIARSKITDMIVFDKSFINDSLDAAGISANYFSLSDAFVLNTLHIYKAKINLDIVLTNSIFGSTTKSQNAVICSQTEAKNINFTNSICIGQVNLHFCNIQKRLNFSYGRFIGHVNSKSDTSLGISGTETFQRAIDAEKLTVGKQINFNSQDIHSLDKEQTPDKQIEYFDRIKIRLEVELKQINDLLNQGSVDPMFLEDKKHLEFILLRNRVGKAKTKRGYTLIIGEASFEGIIVDGSMDCAGAIFYNSPHQTDIPQIESPITLKKIFTTLTQLVQLLIWIILDCIWYIVRFLIIDTFQFYTKPDQNNYVDINNSKAVRAEPPRDRSVNQQKHKRIAKWYNISKRYLFLRVFFWLPIIIALGIIWYPIKLFKIILLWIGYLGRKSNIDRKNHLSTKITQIKKNIIGDYFYEIERPWRKAISLRYAKINGELFLNNGDPSCSTRLPFAPTGEVDLHSAKVDNFYVSPELGTAENTRWRITGLKYDYIYADDDNNANLVNCQWFHDYLNDDSNYKQPYEQLAATFLKMGDDTNARQVLMTTPGKRVGEIFLMTLLSLIEWLSLPPYRALFSVVILWLIGTVWFSKSYYTDHQLTIVNRAIMKNPKDTSRASEMNLYINFSPPAYALQSLVPFISSQQKDLFGPASNDLVTISVPKWFPFIQDIKFSWFAVLYALYSFVGLILISLFLIGIARIIKNT